jgi:predicted ribosomally synthesized peptide with SipW-like signal peptide
MKKILLSVSTLAFIGALVAGGTYAAWNATAGIDGNTVSTGSLSLNIEKEGGFGALEKPVIAGNLFPGQWAPGPGVNDEFRAVVKNDSSVAVDIEMYVDDENGLTNENNVCDYMLLTVRTFTPAGVGFDVETIVDSEPVSSLFGEDNAVTVQNNVASDLEIAVRQKVQLDPEAPNTVQGSECKWNEIFVATISE